MGSILRLFTSLNMNFFRNNQSSHNPENHPRRVEKARKLRRPNRIGRMAFVAGMLPSISFAPSHVDANNQQLGASQKELSLIGTRFPDDVLEVMSFNIADGRYGIAKVTNTIEREDPDIVALQEVSAENLEYIVANTSLKTSLQGAGSRNAILTNLEVLDSDVVLLHNAGKREQRTLELATLEFNGVQLLAGSFHQVHEGSAIFGDANSDERLQQSIDIATVTDDPKYDGLTKIISGDANTSPHSEHYDVITRNLSDATSSLGGSIHTFRGFLYDSQKDYTLLSNDAQAIEQHTIDLGASDHYGLITTVLLDN